MLSAPRLVATCKAVVFDCAGTLLRLDPTREVIFRDAATELGLELRLTDITRAYDLVEFALKMRSSELATDKAKADFYWTYNLRLCVAMGIRQSAESLHTLLGQRFAERRNWVAFEDAAEALSAIGKRKPVHVLANWDKGLDTVLRRAGLRGLIVDAVASAMLGTEKPSRACFDAFLHRNNLAAERVLYVGNEYVADVMGAREAGLIPVLIDRDDRLPAADCLRIRRLTDLLP